MSELALAAVLAVTILIASTVSVEIGLSVALIELAAGVVVGNVFTVTVPDWLAFIGSFAGVVLTFLAGAEVDVPQFRREWRASVAIGAVSFAGPVRGRDGGGLLGWSAGTATRPRSAAWRCRPRASRWSTPCWSRPASTARSSASGSCRATFVTDILTVIGLSVLFITPNLWIDPVRGGVPCS